MIVDGIGGTERVSLLSRRGARLAGVWHAGRGSAGVVVCHGMESTKDGTKSVRLAHAFAACGVTALRFDFSYVGESEGEFADLTVSGEVEDLIGAYQFMRARLKGPIGVVGSSLGGTVALLFAAQQSDVAAVATIAAPAHPGARARALPREERERWRREGLYEVHGARLKATFLDDAERLDVPAALGSVRCPLLVTHGGADTVVPYSDAEDLVAASFGAARLLRYDAADHCFSDASLLDELLTDIVEWMTGQLAGLTATDARHGLGA